MIHGQAILWLRQFKDIFKEVKTEVNRLERIKEKVAVVVPYYHSDLSEYEKISL